MIARWDRAVVEAVQHLHWGPANWFFEHLSDWWVHSVLIVGIALGADLLRRGIPIGALLSVGCYFTAEVVSTVLKHATERPRPSLVDPNVHPLVAVPHSYSMPSGHATAAFAVALAAGLVHRRLLWPLLGLAALVAFSRVWLGVHYLTDVLVGAALGTAIAIGAWLLVSRAGGRALRARGRSAG